MSKYKIILSGLAVFAIALYLHFNAPTQESIQASSTQIDQSIANIQVDLAIADLIIETKDTNSIQVALPELRGELSNNFEFDVDVDGDTLIVNSSQKGGILNWRFKSPFRDLDPVIISLPYDTNLEKLTIDSDMGSTDLNNVSAQNLDIVLDMGSLYLENGEFFDSNIQLSMGSIDFDHTIFNDAFMEVDMGSLEGIVALIGNHELLVSMGSVELGLLQAKANTEIESDVDMGNIEISTNLKEKIPSQVEVMDKPAQLSIKVDMGSIDLNFIK